MKMKKMKKVLLILLSIFLVFNLVGCGSENVSADDNYNYTGSSKEEVRIEIENMLNQLTGIVKYEISDNLFTVTLYVNESMQYGTYDEKKEFLTNLSKFIQLTTMEYDVNKVNVYVKDYQTNLNLYSIEGEYLNI